MIKEFVDRFMEKKSEMLEGFIAKKPEGYLDLFTRTMEVLQDENGIETYPDPKRIVVINYAWYQGTLVFVVAANGYQPDSHWYTKVSYGSCSNCDTFQSISGCAFSCSFPHNLHSNYDDQVTDEEAKEFWTLCLHMLQGLKEM